MFIEARERENAMRVPLLLAQIQVQTRAGSAPAIVSARRSGVVVGCLARRPGQNLHDLGLRRTLAVHQIYLAAAA